MKNKILRTIVMPGIVFLCLAALPAVAQTPDGMTPAEESVCSEESGAAFGLCNAYCEAMDCHLLNDGDPETNPSASEKACMRIWDNYIKLTGEPLLPCDENGCPEPGSGSGSGGEGCGCIESDDCAPGFVCTDDSKICFPA